VYDYCGVFVQAILFSLPDVTRHKILHDFMVSQGYVKVPSRSFVVRKRDPLYVRRDWMFERNLVFF
jgi:hypothetical protein